MPNISQFKTHKEYLDWYRNYRKLKKEKLNTYHRVYRSKNRTKDVKFKDSARHKVFLALKDKTLTKKPCTICGSKKSEAHHEDYSKPLDVIWLCRTHHNQRHKSNPFLQK